MQKSPIYLSVLAVASGAILPFAFAPFGYYLLTELGLIMLLMLWVRSSPGWAFWYGWMFGVGFFTVGIYWVYISIHRYGHAPVALAVAILGLLIAFMALYFAGPGYLLQKFFAKNKWQKFFLIFPISLIIFEWIRGWFLSGFPWLFLGYSHIDAPLCGFAPVLGVYGVSFAIAQTAGVIVYGFYNWKNKKVLAISLIYILLIWGIGFGLSKINWVKAAGEDIAVSLVQGNISQERKWNPKELWNILNSYVFLTAKNLDSRIIVWPEAAIPATPEEAGLFLKTLAFGAKKSNTTILSGVPFYDRENKKYYNGIIALGAENGRYYKRQLVPFGEYLPLKFLLSWLHNFVTIPMSGFSSGPKHQPDLIAGGVLFAPFVCYEIAYAHLVLDYLPRANMLLTVCDDSWFGESIASAQHLEIARMRSLEVGRSQLLCGNTGITAIIDEQGKIIAVAPIMKQTVLNAKVKKQTGSTPWVKLIKATQLDKGNL